MRCERGRLATEIKEMSPGYNGRFPLCPACKCVLIDATFEADIRRDEEEEEARRQVEA